MRAHGAACIHACIQSIRVLWKAYTNGQSCKVNISPNSNSLVAGAPRKGWRTTLKRPAIRFPGDRSPRRRTSPPIYALLLSFYGSLPDNSSIVRLRLVYLIMLGGGREGEGCLVSRFCDTQLRTIESIKGKRDSCSKLLKYIVFNNNNNKKKCVTP